MTIFKYLNERRGSLHIALGMSASIGLLSYALVRALKPFAANELRNSFENLVNMDAHSVANLLKQDLLKNYGNFKNLTNLTWAPCRTGDDSPHEFLILLRDPTLPKYSASCRNVPFSFSHFRTTEAVSTQAVRLSDLSLKEYTPVEEINNFRHRFRFSNFNSDPMRDTLVSELLVESNSKETALRKILQVVIDVGRTLRPAPRSLTARICRNISGSVCDSEFVSVLDLSFLDSSGRIMNVSFNTFNSIALISNSGLSQNPLAASVKLSGVGGRIDYRSNSFCISAIGGTNPLLYVLDGAQDAFGSNYFLTVHGKLVRGDGSSVWPNPDPKYTSLAFDNLHWLLLRSDGAIFKTKNIEDPSSFSRVEGLSLPMAVALSTGAGPDPCP